MDQVLFVRIHSSQKSHHATTESAATPKNIEYFRAKKIPYKICHEGGGASHWHAAGGSRDPRSQSDHGFPANQ